MQYDHAVCYTDGCHYDAINGTGAGLHLILFNDEDVKHGVLFPDSNEVFTEKGFVKKNKWTGETTKDQGNILRFDGLLPLKAATAQYAELSALTILLYDTLLWKHLKSNGSLTVFTDSTYTVNTYTIWIDGWYKKNWTRDGVSPVKNLDVVLRMFDAKNNMIKNQAKVTVEYIPGHKGFYGNEYVDRLSKEAATYAGNNPVEVEAISWVPLEMKTFEDVEDSIADAIVKSREVSTVKKEDLVPALVSAKLNYVITNEGNPFVEVCGNKFYYQMSGDHAATSASEDLAVIGKYIPDALFSVAFSKRPWDYFQEIADEHYKAVWEGKPLLQRYDSAVIIHTDNMKRKSFMSAFKGNKVPYDEMVFAESGNCWMHGKLLISRIQRPPLLSYRILDIRSELVDMLKTVYEMVIEGKTKEDVVLTDITRLLFDDKDKPSKTFYRNVDTVFSVDVKHPCGDDILPLRFSRSISLLERSNINRIHNAGGKWVVYCKKHGDFTFKYGIAYVHPEEAVLFSAYYRNLRIVNEPS